MNLYILNIPTHTRTVKYILLLVSVFTVMMFLRMNDVTLRYRENRYRKFGEHKYFHGDNKFLLVDSDSDQTRKNKVHFSPRHVLCVSFKGRLGNIMFQYASAFGISKQKNMTLRISELDRVAEIFNTSAQKVPDQTYCQNAYKRFEKIHCAFDPSLLNFTQIYVKLHDYLQSWKYFATADRQLRQEFRFNDNVQIEAESVFRQAIQNTKFAGQNATYVGVHIRRGDMFYAQIKNESQVSGYNVAPLGYIRNAIEYFRKRFHKVTFLICSDDIRWSIWQLGRYQKLLNLVFIHKKPEVDMAILGMCNHTIMTTGTFGWWAGWLAGGTTVYYKHYVKQNSALRKQFSSNFSDFFYPGWLALE